MNGCFCFRRRKSGKKRWRKGGHPDDDPGIQLQINERRSKAKGKLEGDRAQLEECLGFADADPFAVVPEVVMLDYLEKYLNPRDKMSLSRASPTAAKLLEKARVKYLFVEILPIHNFSSLLSKQDVTNLRAVCRDWKRGFENFWDAMNDPPVVDPLISDSSYISILKSPYTMSLARARQRHLKLLKMCTPNLNSSALCDRVMDQEESLGLDTDTDRGIPPPNPFLSRRVSFQPNYQFGDDVDEEDFYWASVFLVLDRYGKELRSTRIYCCLEVRRALWIVKECLDRLPNLTTLDCDLFKIFGVGREDLDRLPLTQYPPLPHLKRLTISYGFGPIYESMSSAGYFDQVVSLQVQNSPSFMTWYNPQVQKFPSLQHLAICIEDDKHLLKLKGLSSPLREIDIRSAIINLSPSVYFYFVSHFRETLSALKIDLDFICDSGYANNVLQDTLESIGALKKGQVFDLPHLKTLSMNIIECGYGPVDPLLQLSHPPEYLEVIVVSCPWKGIHAKRNNKTSKRSGSRRGGRNGKTLEIHEHRRNMYASNVWEMLPFLKRIHMRETPTIGRDHWLETYYSREGYELLQDNDVWNYDS